MKFIKNAYTSTQPVDKMNVTVRTYKSLLDDFEAARKQLKECLHKDITRTAVFEAALRAAIVDINNQLKANGIVMCQESAEEPVEASEEVVEDEAVEEPVEASGDNEEPRQTTVFSSIKNNEKK